MHWEKQVKKNDENNTLTGANGATTRSSLANNGSQEKVKSQLTCYICEKKSCYARICTKPKKNSKN